MTLTLCHDLDLGHYWYRNQDNYNAKYPQSLFCFQEYLHSFDHKREQFKNYDYLVITMINEIK